MQATEPYYRCMTIHQPMTEREIRDMYMAVLRRVGYSYGIRFKHFGEVQVIEFFPKISSFMYQVLYTDILQMVLTRFQKIEIEFNHSDKIKKFLEHVALITDHDFVIHYTPDTATIIFHPALFRLEYQQILWVAQRVGIHKRPKPNEES